MAWQKTASRYVPKWVQTSDDFAVLARTVFVFFRDGVVAGVVLGVLVGMCTHWPSN